MPERSGYSVYFSRHLREKVADWADNSTSSQADILDKALEDFFERHEISGDGTIVQTTDTRGEPTDGFVEELLDNQEEIIALLERGGHPRRTTGQEKNSERITEQSPAPAEDSYEHLRQRYDHDEVINPDDVDPASVTSTRKVAVPVAAGIVNWLVEERGSSIERDELLAIIRKTLDVSDETARSYVDQMVEREVIVPHPSLRLDDDDLETARLRAMTADTSYTPQEASLDAPSDAIRERYTVSMGEFLGPYVGNEWDKEQYYFSAGQMAKKVWPVVATIIREVGVRQQSTNRSVLNGDEMTEYDRAAGAVALNGEIIGIIDDYIDVPEAVSNANSFAKATADEEKRLKWAKWWAEADEWAKSRLFDEEIEEVNGSEAEEVFEDVLGVDVDETGEDGLRDAYNEWMLENHPDQNDDEFDADEFHRVKSAKQKLLE